MSRDQFIHSISSLDARYDLNIRNYFVTTEAIKAVSEFKSSNQAIVGLKGSGKTTLYRSLVEDWSHAETFFTSGLSATDSTFETYFEKINCLQFEASVRVGMLLFILRFIEKNIDSFGGTGSPADWAERRKALLNPREKVRDLLGRFQGFSIMGVGLEISPGERVESFDPLPREDLDDLIRILRNFRGAGRNIRIVIDDPDRLFTRGADFDPHLLAGYILGTNQVAAELGFVQFVHILKSSIYDTLRSVEEMANLPYDYFRRISWTNDELKKLVEERLRFSNLNETDIFDPNLSYILPALISRIRNGPRDLLRYIEIILKSDPHARVSLGTVKIHEAAFRDEARRQMESAYAPVYEGIEAFTETIFSESDHMTVEHFLRKFHTLRIQSNPDRVDYGLSWLRRGERALRALVDAGVVDVKMQGQWIRPFEASHFRFNSGSGTAEIRRNSVFQN